MSAGLFGHMPQPYSLCQIAPLTQIQAHNIGFGYQAVPHYHTQKTIVLTTLSLWLDNSYPRQRRQGHVQSIRHIMLLLFLPSNAMVKVYGVYLK